MYCCLNLRWSGMTKAEPVYIPKAANVYVNILLLPAGTEAPDSFSPEMKAKFFPDIKAGEIFRAIQNASIATTLGSNLPFVT